MSCPARIRSYKDGAETDNDERINVLDVEDDRTVAGTVAEGLVQLHLAHVHNNDDPGDNVQQHRQRVQQDEYLEHRPPPLHPISVGGMGALKMTGMPRRQTATFRPLTTTWKRFVSTIFSVNRTRAASIIPAIICG